MCDSATQTNDLQEECLMCLQDKDVLIEAPCGHAFCNDCMVEWYGQTFIRMEGIKGCPICRRKPESYNDVSTTLFIMYNITSYENNCINFESIILSKQFF